MNYLKMDEDNYEYDDLDQQLLDFYIELNEKLTPQ